jgi:4-hydroxy-2-oxoheptanedioate aldolase
LSTPTPPDAWFIGPTDLALDLGFRGAAAHPEVTTAILAALAAIRAQGAATGIAAADGAAAREWQKRGVGMVAVASDLNLLARAARETVGRR